jgi:ubiquinone/menaquinone biosynthesis C-methylase UbiE
MSVENITGNAEDLSDDFYEDLRPRLYRRIAGELRDAARVLDFGCGGCELARFLVADCGNEVVGVDVADAGFPDPQRMSADARRRLQCIKADARRLPLPRGQRVDAAVTTYALHEMGRPGEVLEEVRRVLRPGGELLAVDFPRGSLAQRLWGESYFSAEEVADILEAAGLGNVSAVLIERGQIIWARGFRADDDEVES